MQFLVLLMSINISHTYIDVYQYKFYATFVVTLTDYVKEYVNVAI